MLPETIDSADCVTRSPVTAEVSACPNPMVYAPPWFTRLANQRSMFSTSCTIWFDVVTTRVLAE